MDTEKMIDPQNVQKFVEQNKIQINAQMFEEESVLLDKAKNVNPHELANDNLLQRQDAQRIKTQILANFTNYKFVGDERLELSVNRREGKKKNMGGTKRKFRSHVLGSDLRRKRVNKEAALQLTEERIRFIDSLRKKDSPEEQGNSTQLNEKEFAQIFNSLDLSQIDLSTDEKVIKSGPRMNTLCGMLRHNAILDNHFISKEKLQLVGLLVDYYEARMNLICDENYASKYNSELEIGDVSDIRPDQSFLNGKLKNCRDMALKLQDFRVISMEEEAVRTERMDGILQNVWSKETTDKVYKVKRVDFNEGVGVLLDYQTLDDVRAKLHNEEGEEWNEIRDSIQSNYDTASELYDMSIRRVNWTNYRYHSLTKDANSAFLDYFRSLREKKQVEGKQQELLRKAIKQGREYVNRVLPGGFDEPMSSSEQQEMNRQIQDLIRLTGGELKVPEEVAEATETVKNPYYKRFYSWVNKKDSVLFVHPPVVSDIKDLDKGIPNLRIALSSLVYRSANRIRDSIVDNQDGTVMVRFYEREHNNPAMKRAVYVRVDKSVPELVGMENKDQASLWVRLIEKAYAARFGAGQYEGADHEMDVILDRLLLSHAENSTLSQLHGNLPDNSLSMNPDEVRANMDLAIEECQKKYNTVTPSVVQVMDYATKQAYLRNEDREYATRYLAYTVGLNMDLFSENYTDTAVDLVDSLGARLRAGEVIFVSSTLREDGLDNERKKNLEKRGLRMNHRYQVLEVSRFDSGNSCIILRDPYMISGTEYDKEQKPQKMKNASEAGGSFAMEINDFMNSFIRVVR